jgi:LemA protein
MVLLEIILMVVGAIIVIILLAIVLIYNGFVSKRNRVQDAWAQIDVQLKRRYDLIPNLVDAVKGYMKYERAVLTTVTNLRSSIVSGTTEEKAQANNQISQALKTIFAVAENYPQLKASENFQSLQEALVDTENRISFVRTSYNDYVLDYNNALQTFPGNVFANNFHFEKADFFKAPDEANEPVKVNFDDVNGPSGADQDQNAEKSNAQTGKTDAKKSGKKPKPQAAPKQ